MSGKKVIVLAIAFFTLMAAFSVAIIIAASGDNVNNSSALHQPINKANLKSVTVNLQGMTCEACEKTITTITGKVSGVTDIKASFMKQTAIVEFDQTQTDVRKIMDSIGSTGYKVLGYEDSSGKHKLMNEKTAPHNVTGTMKCGAGKCGGASKCGAQ